MYRLLDNQEFAKIFQEVCEEKSRRRNDEDMLYQSLLQALGALRDVEEGTETFETDESAQGQKIDVMMKKFKSPLETIVYSVKFKIKGEHSKEFLVYFYKTGSEFGGAFTIPLVPHLKPFMLGTKRAFLKFFDAA